MRKICEKRRIHAEVREFLQAIRGRAAWMRHILTAAKEFRVPIKIEIIGPADQAASLAKALEHSDAVRAMACDIARPGPEWAEPPHFLLFLRTEAQTPVPAEKEERP
jgi:hypothetical protein